MTRRIYTRTGDAGETGLFGRGRVSKASPRVEAYGEVDELNATLGWAASQSQDERVVSLITTLQADLFAIGAHLAAPGRTAGLPELPTDRAKEMEDWIDTADAQLPELRSFILPGGSPSGAALHVARTVCRRAERRVVSLAATEEVDASILIYLNRLSDLLFTAARLVNHRAGQIETRWEPRPR
jgi:cob(I)alamin adenosyltransferase